MYVMDFPILPRNCVDLPSSINFQDWLCTTWTMRHPTAFKWKWWVKYYRNWNTLHSYFGEKIENVTITFPLTLGWPRPQLVVNNTVCSCILTNQWVKSHVISVIHWITSWYDVTVVLVTLPVETGQLFVHKYSKLGICNTPYFHIILT